MVIEILTLFIPIPFPWQIGSSVVASSTRHFDGGADDIQTLYTSKATMASFPKGL